MFKIVVKKCSWPQLHSDIGHILQGKFRGSDKVIVTSDEGEAVYFTRSVKRMLDVNSNKSYETLGHEYLTKFTTSLYQELSTVFTVEDKQVIETSRRINDWGSLAIKLKTRSVPILHTLEKKKFSKACFDIDRNIKQFEEEEISTQFRIFLERLEKHTTFKTVQEIEQCDPKELIKDFMKDESMYSGIEIVMQACAVGAVKISVESVAESMISKYNIHASNIRPIGESVGDDEMMIDYNGPEIGEADPVLLEALHLHFKGNSKGIHFRQFLPVCQIFPTRPI